MQFPMESHLSIQIDFNVLSQPNHGQKFLTQVIPMNINAAIRYVLSRILPFIDGIFRSSLRKYLLKSLCGISLNSLKMVTHIIWTKIVCVYPFIHRLKTQVPITNFPLLSGYMEDHLCLVVECIHFMALIK